MGLFGTKDSGFGNLRTEKLSLHRPQPKYHLVSGMEKVITMFLGNTILLRILIKGPMVGKPTPIGSLKNHN